MRAKEYIACSGASLKYPAEIKQIIADMLPLRASREHTVDYYNKHLIPDIRRQGYLLQKDLFDKNNAMQTEAPEPFQMNAGELPVETASAIRDELFEVIKDDKSFGHLYSLLGNLRNSQHPSNPIDCVPDERGIVDALKKQRDDYPKSDLAEYLDDDLNFAQYRKLRDSGISDEAALLAWFNNAYHIYDELRLVKANPLAASRFYQADESCVTPEAKTQTYRFICTLIETTAKDDKRLGRIREELLRVLPADPSSDDNTGDDGGKTKGNNKIKTVVICELLNKLGRGKSFNDLSKICRLVAYLTGGSEKKLYNDAQKGIQFSDFHKNELSEVNNLLDELGLQINLTKDKEY